MSKNELIRSIYESGLVEGERIEPDYDGSYSEVSIIVCGWNSFR